MVKYLASKNAWLALLHYRESNLFGQITSEADDRAFFFSLQGKTDPQAELIATLNVFLYHSDREKLRCRFPARYHWLSQQINFKDRYIAESRCLRFIEWREKIRAKAVTLVFPASYLNSPSSMFGHTFLRLDKEPSDRNHSLLGYTINYAADANSWDNEIAFAYKGIFGGYPGVISVQPYYEKVKEYSEWENRDIWEYRLNLTVDEIDQLIRHIWELLHVRFDYFFIDENCSYRLLRFLEVARPTLDLTGSFSYRAIPADTVRVVVETGLVQDRTYRPSPATQLRHHIKQLQPEELGFVTAITDDDTDMTLNKMRQSYISAESRARILEVAYEYLHFRLIDEKNPRQQPIAEKLYRILLQRSKIPTPTPLKNVSTPIISDDKGHRTSRFSTGIGWRDGSEFLSLQFRSAYHDLVDPFTGYQNGAAINFMDADFRVYESGALQLEKLTILGITSLTPRDDFFKPLSWAMSLGTKRKHYDGERALFGFLKGGAGFTYGSDANMVFGILSAAVEIGDTFDRNFALGPDVNFGWLYQGFGGQGLLSLNSSHFILGDRHKTTVLDYKHTINVAKDNALEISFSHERSDENSDNEIQIVYRRYF